jgi:hypothetical protein
MKQRCSNPNDWAYDYYGGRPDSPITVDEYYSDDFPNWYADIGYQLHDNHLSQDRIDNDSGYRPGNVRAADTATQLANQRPRRKKSKTTKPPRVSERTSAADDFIPPPF